MSGIEAMLLGEQNIESRLDVSLLLQQLADGGIQVIGCTQLLLVRLVGMVVGGVEGGRGG